MERLFWLFIGAAVSTMALVFLGSTDPVNRFIVATLLLICCFALNDLAVRAWYRMESGWAPPLAGFMQIVAGLGLLAILIGAIPLLYHVTFALFGVKSQVEAVAWVFFIWAWCAIVRSGIILHRIYSDRRR